MYHLNRFYIWRAHLYELSRDYNFVSLGVCIDFGGLVKFLQNAGKKIYLRSVFGPQFGNWGTLELLHAQLKYDIHLPCLFCKNFFLCNAIELRRVRCCFFNYSVSFVKYSAVRSISRVLWNKYNFVLVSLLWNHLLWTLNFQRTSYCMLCV